MGLCFAFLSVGNAAAFHELERQGIMFAQFISTTYDWLGNYQSQYSKIPYLSQRLSAV